MTKRSAGLLLFRRRGSEVEVLLVHPGGPFFAKKDDGVWSIPKGVIDPDEDELLAAQRELLEETGFTATGGFHTLGELRQSSGKIVVAWAVEQDADPSAMRSNTFSMEWPPKSGRVQEFPEVDRCAWFTLEQARVKIVKGQSAFLDRLLAQHKTH